VSTKFDIYKNKKFLPIIYANNEGSKLRKLRLKDNISMHDLSKKISISETTLMHIEQNKIKNPYYYWKIICDYFNVNHIEYLNLKTMKEDNIIDKLIKLRAFIGTKSWAGVGKYLGYSGEFISDLISRYTPNKSNIEKINNAIKDFM
jgi:transcriptional regulator with XRE-family HTH domain